MYRIILSKQYKRAVKKIIKSGNCNIFEIQKVINIIASGGKLDTKYRDHALKGNMSQYRECHIQGDLLLIYCLNNNELILLLINIGNHSELFS
ncbi:MAG: type II toxin-antitoxin system mRNA interferase toxin, RelE/StbE family [bacterium]